MSRSSKYSIPFLPITCASVAGLTCRLSGQGASNAQHRPQRFGDQGSAWDVEQRRLEQDERVDNLRRIERQPQGDDPARGMADDVGTLDAEVPQQGAAIGGLLGETERRFYRAAAGVAAPVVAHQAVAV